jgi:hypothetical protein
VRRAATSREDEVADRLDRAMAGADLRMTRPRWWGAARLAQRALAAVAAAGALWLIALAALGWLQLGDVVPTPEVKGIAVPTLLLGGGLLLGALLAFLAGRANAVGARRRTRRARRALDERVAAVADDLVLAPLRAELEAHDALRAQLETAGAGGRRRGLRRRVEAAVTA